MNISEKEDIPEPAQPLEQALPDTELDGVTGGAGLEGQLPVNKSDPDFDPSQFEKIETLNRGESVPVVAKKP